MILDKGIIRSPGCGFTRMSGDDPYMIEKIKNNIMFYPHERG